MQFTVAKKTLAEMLSLLERIVPNRSASVSLTNLRVEPCDKGLTFTGTNLELDLEVTLPVLVADPQPFMVPGHLFASVVKNLPGDTVDVKLEGTTLTVQGGGAVFNLSTGDVDTFPFISYPDHYQYVLDAEELKKSLGSVKYAAAAEDFRAVFRGVQLELQAGKSRDIATDGFRLAYRDFDAARAGNAGAFEERKILIPARSIDDLTRVLKDGDVRFSVTQGNLNVFTDTARMNVKLMDGTLPDYERVIPASTGTSITVDVSRLREALMRVRVVAEKDTQNRVDFMLENGLLRLVAEANSGNARDELEVSQDHPGGLQIGFKVNQVLDALSPMGDTAVIGFNAVGAPAVFRDPNDPKYLAIVVSLRLGA
ncbi:MAG TPA: DNA polymerase III subunit beta [Deinococcales bacterium]|nr:DNA polymerase III subunit beta [Deinococcales bacterium]